MADNTKPTREGRPYQPSNGTDGDIFMSQHCDICAKSMTCQIPMLTMIHDRDDPRYPKEWTYDKDGKPTCTAMQFIGMG